MTTTTQKSALSIQKEKKQPTEQKHLAAAFLNTHQDELRGYVREQLKPFIEDRSLDEYMQGSNLRMRYVKGFSEPDSDENRVKELAMLRMPTFYRRELDDLFAFMKENNMTKADLTYKLKGFDNPKVQEFVTKNYYDRQQINYTAVTKKNLLARGKIPAAEIEAFFANYQSNK